MSRSLPSRTSDLNSARSDAPERPQSNAERRNAPPDLNLKIRYVPISELKCFERELKRHSEKQVAKITDSILQFGMIAPLLIDSTQTIVAGHARFKAAAAAGHDRVPVIDLPHLSPAQARMYRIADNRLSELGHWDDAALKAELQALWELDRSGDLPFSLEISGFDFADIDARLTGARQLEDFEKLPGLPANAVSRPGDKWILGRHVLTQGDVRDPGSLGLLCGPELMDAAFLDPPYNVRIQGHVSGKGSAKHPEFAMASGEMSSEQFSEFLRNALEGILAHMAAGAILFVCMDHRHTSELLSASRQCGLEYLNLCVWNKQSGAMGSLYRSQHELVFVLKKPGARHKNQVELGKHGRNKTNVWDYPGLANFGRTRKEDLAAHPTVKNTNMVADAIRDVTEPKDLVIDAFCGSGTTILAAERTGRRARCLEIASEYVDVAIKRWQLVSGQHAVLGATGKTFAEMEAVRSKDVTPASELNPPIISVRRRIR